MNELDRLVWAATSTFLVGTLHVGVRSSTEEADALLRALLADHLSDVRGAPANYSLLAAPPGTGGRARRRVHQLFRSSHAVARRRSGAGAVEALLAHLSALAAPAPEVLLAVRGVALVSADGTAVLAPAALIEDDLAHVEPRLRRLGLRIVDGPVALVDPATAELVVPPASLHLSAPGLDRLAAWARAERSDETVAPGRHPLVAWVTFAGEPHGLMAPDRARAWAYPTVVRAEGSGVGASLDRLDRVLAATPAHSLAPGGPGVAAQLARLARRR